MLIIHNWLLSMSQPLDLKIWTRNGGKRTVLRAKKTEYSLVAKQSYIYKKIIALGSSITETECRIKVIFNHILFQGGMLSWVFEVEVLVLKCYRSKARRSSKLWTFWILETKLAKREPHICIDIPLTFPISIPRQI